MVDLETLAEADAKFCASLLPDALAKRTAPQLVEIAKEIRIQHRNAEMAEADAARCERAAVVLRKLETEVFRLRQAIGCYADGRLGLPELTEVSRSWNKDSTHAG